MEAILKNKILGLKKVFILTVLLINTCGYIVAEKPEYKDIAPYPYRPIEGTKRYHKQTADIPSSFTFKMSDLSTLDEKDSCLMVSLSLNFDIKDTKNENKPMIAFSYKNKKILEIRYSQRTVTIKRYNRVGDKSYDYHLFDPLFPEDPDEDNMWKMYFYFTANFMYIVASDDVTNDNNGVTNNYLSPVYFGLDIPNSEESIMDKFLRKSPDAVIIAGDTNSPDAYVASFDIYSMHYSNNKLDADNLYWSLQENFSSPNPPTKSE